MTATPRRSRLARRIARRAASRHSEGHLLAIPRVGLFRELDWEPATGVKLFAYVYDLS